jgi:hypothetical protein
MKNLTDFWNAVKRQSDGESGAATPEAPAVVEAPVVADAGQEAASAEAPLGNDESTIAESSAKPPQGLLDRIGQLTRQKRELEERLQQVESYRQQQYTPQEAESAPYDPRTVQLEIHRQAQELAKQQAWKDTTDKIWNEGLSKYGDWAPQLNNMAQILGGIPTTLTEAAIESGTPHEVLYHLAKNPDEAARIALLPPTRQAVAIAKVAQNLNAPKRVSAAPPPITPKVNGAGTAPATLDDPDISMEEWIRLRNAQAGRRRR